MTHTASFWASESPLVPLTMALLALPIFLLCACWVTAYLLLMGVRHLSEVGIRLLERIAE